MGGQILSSMFGGAYPPPTSCSGFFEDGMAVAGTKTTQIDTGQNHNHTAYNDSHTNLDAISVPFYLALGTYTVSVLGKTANSLGKLDWYVDNVLQTSGQDWYTAGSVNNVIKTFLITVLTSGPHTLKAIVNTKNASSSDFYFLLTKFSIA